MSKRWGFRCVNGMNRSAVIKSTLPLILPSLSYEVHKASEIPASWLPSISPFSATYAETGENTDPCSSERGNSSSTCERYSTYMAFHKR